ncbi:MAG: amidohydrolase family protein [Actinoplanes sp.]
MSGPVDAHVHLWNRATDPQPWIDPESMAVIDREFSSGDAEQMLDATGVDTAVIWESGLRALAVHPHVYAKTSGLAGLVDDPARLRRVVGVGVEAVGPDRLMYGSDWPLAQLGAGPVAWRAAVDELVGELSAGERHAIMSGTASACYALTP